MVRHDVLGHKTLTPSRSPSVFLFDGSQSNFYLSANSPVLRPPIHEGNTNAISSENEFLSALRTLEPQATSAAAECKHHSCCYYHYLGSTSALASIGHHRSIRRPFQRHCKDANDVSSSHSLFSSFETFLLVYARYAKLACNLQVIVSSVGGVVRR